MGVLRAGEDAVLTPWKVLSHDAEVILPHDLRKKQPRAGGKEEEMAASPVNVCPGSEAMSAFPPEMPWINS